VGDTLIGAAALAAEYNGVEKASAVKDKLIEMTHLNETLYCCGIACSSQGFKTKAGNYQIDLLLANVCKQNVTRFPYEIVRLAEDIAGGLVVTMPSQKDFHSDTVVGRNGETIGEICNKFFVAREGVKTEDRQRVLRFIENLCLGAAAVGYRTESMHGAGSPQAQRIMIARQGNTLYREAPLHRSQSRVTQKRFQINLIPFDAVLQILTAHMKAPGRCGDIAAAGTEGLTNGVILHILHGAAERVPQRHFSRAFSALRQDQFRQIFRRNHRHGVRQNVYGVFNGMLKFPDVSGPVVILESLQCL